MSRWKTSVFMVSVGRMTSLYPSIFTTARPNFSTFSPEKDALAARKYQRVRDACRHQNVGSIPANRAAGMCFVMIPRGKNQDEHLGVDHSMGQTGTHHMNDNDGDDCHDENETATKVCNKSLQQKSATKVCNRSLQLHLLSLATSHCFPLTQYGPIRINTVKHSQQQRRHTPLALAFPSVNEREYEALFEHASRR